MLINSIRFNSFLLGIFALVTAGLLAGTQMGTKDRIAAAERAVAQKALLAIVPRERHSNDLLADTVAIPSHFWPMLGLDGLDEHKVNIALDGDNPVAVIIPAVAPDGYNGDIRMIIGINLNGADDGTIAGVRIVQHRETPGLGDKVDTNKSDWVLNFNGKSLLNPNLKDWQVRKDNGEFDQFTGATITPRAVVRQVAKALQYFEEDKQRLLKASQKLNKAKAQQPDKPTTAETEPADHG